MATTLRTLLALILLTGSAAAEAPPATDSPPATEADRRGPPPNPAKGEPYDGVSRGRPARDYYLAVPRFLLLPLRFIMWAVAPPIQGMVEFEQRHHIYDHLYDAFTSDDGQIGARPSFTWVRSFRPSFGVHFFDDALFGPGTKFNVDLSGGVDVGRAAVHLRPTRVGRRVQVLFDAAFDHRNDWIYTGLGATAPPQPNALPAARYLQNALDVDGRVNLHATRFLFFSFGGFFGLRRFANGETYDGNQPIDQVYCVRVNGVCARGTVSDVLVPGFNNGTQFARAAAGVHLNLRDSLIRASTGALVDAEADYSHGLGSDSSSYFRFRGAVTLNFNLWAHSHVLFLRGATEVVEPVGNDTVPFSELAVLGGPFDLRGFRVQSFRDFSSLIATAEYRWPILLWMDGALFADYGGVYGRDYQGFGANQMQPDIGVGVRIQSRDRFYMRVQFAYGFGNSWQLYVTGMNLP